MTAFMDGPLVLGKTLSELICNLEVKLPGNYNIGILIGGSHL